MNRIIAALAIAFSFSAPARAINSPVTQESDKLWSVASASFTSATSYTFDVAGYGSVGYSSRTANINGFAYWVYPKGADANFLVVQTTKTPNGATNPANFNNSAPFDIAASVAVLSTSTLVTVPSGIAYPGKFEETNTNPVFYFSNLSSAATYYIILEYGAQRKP